MRIMGLDYGARTVGVALSDELLVTAQPKEIIRRDRESKLRRTLARIEELIVEAQVGVIVCGLPLNMDGTEGERAKLASDFAETLHRRTGLPVFMQDERLTTVESDEIMDSMGIRAEDRKKFVDMIAANVILQEFMENHPDELAGWRGAQPLR